MTPLRRPSPNFGPRREGAAPDMIVLHYTAMADLDEALKRLCDPAAEVSAHYLITREGDLIQLVDEEMRAWHAGAGSWGGEADINSRSIGVELDNAGAQPFSEPLMASLEKLLRDVMSRWMVPPERVIAHSDMAPARKADPGAKFDWLRLARQGLSVWAGLSSAGSGENPAEAADERSFHEAADAFGYPRADLATRLAAFRLRFRPFAQGRLSKADFAFLADLAAHYPVDRKRPSA